MSFEDPDEGRRGTPATRRRLRQADILAATRALFDARGMADAQIEDIAVRVGINRAIIYRHFTGKEELFALTLVSYLDELSEQLRDADSLEVPPEERLRTLTAAFVDYGLAHPAFVDCALTMMRRPGAELLEEVSETAARRLGHGVSACLAGLVAAVHAGADAGVFHVGDVDVLAGTLCASALGGLQLARVGRMVTESAPGVQTTVAVAGDQVREHLVASSVAMAKGAA